MYSQNNAKVSNKPNKLPSITAKKEESESSEETSSEESDSDEEEACSTIYNMFFLMLHFCVGFHLKRCN